MTAEEDHFQSGVDKIGQNIRSCHPVKLLLLVPWFINSLTYFRRSSGDLFDIVRLGLSLREEIVEVLFGEFPLEWSGDQFVMMLEAKDTLLERIQGREVIRSERLSLQNREVDSLSSHRHSFFDKTWLKPSTAHG